jgi:diguanylate cyclase (GGDEF)-like protein
MRDYWICGYDRPHAMTDTLPRIPARVDALVRPAPLVVDCDTSLLTALAPLSAGRHQCVVVVRDGLPIGVITPQDIPRLFVLLAASPGLGAMPVAEVMSSPPVTVAADSSLFDAIVIAEVERLDVLPVVDEHGRLAGIVTLVDLLKANIHFLDVQIRRVEFDTEKKQESWRARLEQLSQLAMEDPDFGTGSRRALESALRHQQALARRYGRAYSVLRLEVDWFEALSEQNGHESARNEVRKVCEAMAATLRSSDRLYRFDVTEFVAVLADTREAGARQVAEKLRARVQELAIPQLAGPYGVMTITIGIASGQGAVGSPGWSELLDLAGQRLREARRLGGNRVFAARARPEERC